MPFESFPFVVGWELTLACNLKCRHCGSDAGRKRAGELTREESLALCEQFPALLVQEVDFTGGEPLLNRDWYDIACCLRDYGIPVKMVTNGTLITAEITGMMKRAGLRTIGFSIDGREKTHDYMRGQEGLQRSTLCGIEMVHDAGLEAAVLTTVCSANIDELPAILELLADNGIHRWQVQPLFNFGRAKSDTAMQLDADTYIRLGEFIRAYSGDALSRGIDIEPADSFGYFTELDVREPQWGGCPAGKLACGITSDGRVKGCLSLPDNVVEGSIRDRDLWDIWFDENSFRYTRGFTSESACGECSTCKHLLQCRGGCSSMSYGTTGSFHGDPWCFMVLGKNRGSSG